MGNELTLGVVGSNTRVPKERGRALHEFVRMPLRAGATFQEFEADRTLENMDDTENAAITNPYVAVELSSTPAISFMYLYRLGMTTPYSIAST